MKNKCTKNLIYEKKIPHSKTLYASPRKINPAPRFVAKRGQTEYTHTHIFKNTETRSDLRKATELNNRKIIKKFSEIKGNELGKA